MCATEIDTFDKFAEHNANDGKGMDFPTKLTHKQVDEYFTQHDCTVLKILKNEITSYTGVIFCRNSDPKTALATKLASFTSNPNGVFPLSTSKIGILLREGLSVEEIRDRFMQKETKPVEPEKHSRTSRRKNRKEIPESTLENLIAYAKQEDENKGKYDQTFSGIERMIITVDLVKELCETKGCTFISILNVKDIRINSSITFVKKNDPLRVLTAKLDQLVRDENNEFKISNSSIAQEYLKREMGVKSDDKLVDIPLKRKELALRESMKGENCELISKYEAYNEPVYYLFEGLEYKITPEKWDKGERAHQKKRIQYTHNHVKELFKREGCELKNEYENKRSMLNYVYDGKCYHVSFNDWKYLKKRPHLNKE